MGLGVKTRLEERNGEEFRGKFFSCEVLLQKVFIGKRAFDPITDVVFLSGLGPEVTTEFTKK